ncbi:hypothetical protein LTR84_003617 [Exophiala bonariae]|uniref:Kinetochore protein fta7 n=1 Tax=Exophiala bonariae TaxID=1690606 RepID=A0AAV9N5R4_9EURO|nr:hypothetical protein LTR84_003617 [Exophiala bonariae]
MDQRQESTAEHTFAHLSPRVRHISQSTIRKKWKPLPQSSQDRVRAILLSLKTKRAASGRIPPIGTKRTAKTKRTKNDVMDEDYERAVEEVTNKLLSRLPRMPFPNNATPSSTASVVDEHFSFETTLNRTSSLQSTLTMNQRSNRLLRNQIRREQRALKDDKAELSRLEAALNSSFSLRQKQERGLHPLARLADEGEEEEHEDEDENQRPHKNPTEKDSIDRINDIAGIFAQPQTSTISLDPDQQSHPELAPLLTQLRNHLQSMDNNTASIRPVLHAMSEAQTALDLFAAARFDEQTRRRLHGLDT